MSGVRSNRVAYAPKSATYDLLTEKLSAEGSDAEDMGDGIRVPTLGEHGDGDDTADTFAKFAGLSDGVENFAKQIFCGD